MLEDLDHLADRIRQLTELLDSIQADRYALGRQLAQSQAENQRLRALLALARDRVDSVLTRLPDPDAQPSSLSSTEPGSHGTA